MIERVPPLRVAAPFVLRGIPPRIGRKLKVKKLEQTKIDAFRLCFGDWCGCCAFHATRTVLGTRLDV